MKKLTGILFGSIILCTSNLNAADFGVGVKAGTLGIGADFTVALSKTVNARVSLTTFNIDSETETITIGDSTNQGTITATADFDFGSSALLFDWHVFDGTFHLSAGLIKADIGASLRGTLNDSFEINGQTVEVDDIDGQITGDIIVSDSYKPYIGIGWGRKAAAESGFSFSAELGVAYVDPEVRLNASFNPAAASAITQAELDARLKEAQESADNELADLSIWPVLSIGVNYAF
ncbi:MAG: hypothetical protein ACI9KN_001644 [Gammaproteobacteria bacterium]|jgi:hypothetical protein